MGIAAPVIIVALAAVACGLGVCAVAHRLLNRGGKTDGHCGVHAAEQSRLQKVVPIFFSALFCGLAMAAVLAFLPPR